MSIIDSKILVLGDNASDTELVQSVLKLSYPNIQLAHDPSLHSKLFDQSKPKILVMAFKSLDACERGYLGLYRKSEYIHTAIHKTITLCSKEQVNDAYRLCVDGVFDDYALFWPLAHDAKRLHMSVHIALNALAQAESMTPIEEITNLARQAENLGEQLTEQISKGRILTENARNVATQAHSILSDALIDFQIDNLDTSFTDEIPVKSAASAAKGITQRQRDALTTTFDELLASANPIRKWVETITDELAEPLKAARELAQRAKSIRPKVLLVDDDAFIRKTLAHTLRHANHEVHAVASVESARQVLKGSKPDLILLDYQLPDSTGLSFLREIKATSGVSKVPIMMLTGKSERQVIVDCISAGAVDFVVKPVEKDILLKKMKSYLRCK